MAVALGWKGYVDTDLNFSEFFNGNHTVVLRFMPQFPNAFEGPFVAENGSGTFGIGQGEWRNGQQGTKLYLNVGSQFVTAYYNAVWVPSSVARPAIWDWARNDFEVHAAKMNADGYQLHALNVMTRPAGDAYNAIWVKSTEFRPAIWAWAPKDFDAESARQLASGYQLHAVNTFVRNGQESFNAIWVKSSSCRPALWSYERRHFDASSADMLADGYQLTDLSAVRLT